MKMNRNVTSVLVTALGNQPVCCSVLNADVRNCYTTPNVVICNKLSNDLISTQ